MRAIATTTLRALLACVLLVAIAVLVLLALLRTEK